MKTQTKNRLVFWSRMTGWLGVGAVTPIVTFATKFGLFTKTEVTEDALGNPITSASYAFNGWGIVCCVIIGYYVLQIFDELVKASGDGYSLPKQMLDGIRKLIPLIIIYGICYFLEGCLEQVMFCLAIVIVCRAAACGLNPLPKWRYEKLGKEDYSGLASQLTAVIKKLVKKGE